MEMNELIAAVEAMDPAVLGGAALTLTAILGIGAIGALIRYLMTSIGYSRMYRKAGVPGWKAFIPLYNTYTNYKISWNSKMFFVYIALYVLFYLLYGRTGFVLELAAAVCGISMLVVVFKQLGRMAKLFGKGKGTAFCLFFFPGITSLVLGFGKTEFQK